MNVSNDLKGVDFEWFAVDRNGHIALFVTAGDGFVPTSVLAAANTISALSSNINTPNIGTRLVWMDYGNVGLYVYDWNMSEESYALIQIPLQPLPQNFHQAILDLPALPKFDVEFGTTVFISLIDSVLS